MNSYERQNIKLQSTCSKCKYSSCIYEQNKESVSCPTWCKNYAKGARSNCKCLAFLYNDEPLCAYFEEGKTLTDDELIDKENADYKRYMRIAKRRGFDDAQDNS